MKTQYKYLLLLSLFAVSCSELKEDEVLEPKDQVSIVVNARIASSPETKTVMGDLDESATPNTYPINWSAGDRIGLIYGVGQSVDVAITDGVGTNRGVFAGKAEDIVAPYPGTTLYPAAYPAAKSFATKSESTLLIGSYLPYKQTYREGSFDDNVYPMAALSEDFGEDYDFYNLAGVIQLQIRSYEPRTIRAIYLTGNDKEVIAGGIGMKYDAETAQPIVSTEVKDGPEGQRYQLAEYGSEGYQRVIIDFGEGGLLVNDSHTALVNIAVLPQTFENGFTVELVDDGNLGSTFKEISTPITVARSCVKRMQTFYYEKPEPLEIANSYIYSDAGYYIMPAYCMGNRLDVSLDTEGRNLDAALLWTDVVDAAGNDLGAVTNIEYLSFSDGKGMLQFKINNDPSGNPYRGNAAIALYDKDTKKILWSWPVWMCEEVHDVITDGYCADGSYQCQYPDGSIYDYEAEESTEGQLVIMDRNLGAISANPADGWKTYGLYYQNGRRDPFVGGNYNGSYVRSPLTAISGGDESYIKTNVRYWEDAPFVSGNGTIPTWYNTELAPNGWNYVGGYLTVSEALAHPMDFSCGLSISYNNKGQAQYSGTAQWTDYTAADNQTWMDNRLTGDTDGTHGNTGLKDAGHESYWNRTKTIMDPCPVGYSVLGERDGVFFGKAAKNATATSTYRYSDSEGYGMMHSYTVNGETYNVWWPAAGVRTFYGKMAEVGYCGAYFHYDHIEATHGGHGTYFHITAGGGTLDTTNGTITNHAASLRCVREKQDVSTYPLK
ncbi:MAG: hypothetical protein MJY56_03750 [Bacteroidales bacterium]|nr:hypothetical protein [Bacteroidales bacterium]